MTLCDYDSSSDSDSSTVSYLSEEDFRYPHTGTLHNRSHVSKKRTWSETDDEGDLPGVPDYRQVGNSYTRFCYDSDLDSEEDSRETKRRRAGNGKPVVPIAGGVRDFILVKCPTPAPRPTSAFFPVSIIRKPSRLGSGFELDENMEYLTLDDPSPQNGSELEPILVAHRPAQVQPFVHTYPAPKPTTAVKVRLRKAASSPVEPKPAVLKSAWLGVTSNWSFPSL
ncbi:hypothetical protein N0V85_008487 [Neurospora sp. IMI 360204]|nr:hypothetical protein N0V85_008487 [Neurospora sp. IMI 360204]